MSHLTESQRYTISKMLENGYNQTEIAKTIGRDKSVVCREKKRNCDQRNKLYKHDLANRKYFYRQKYKRKKKFFTETIKSYVEEHLEQKFSPEQIVGNAKKEGQNCVSAERIYQHIWQDKKLGGKLFEELRTQGKRYRKRGAGKDKRGIIIGRRDISERPQVVETKQRIGDLEIDLIIGKYHQGAILTINDRVSGMLKMKKLESKNADELAVEAIKLLAEWKEFLHTITSDNGKEFAAHKTISDALGIDFFFAEPYHSWQRGANENLNGLIRQYIPKQTDFSTITDEFVAYVENELNNRPRKRHNFETPIFVFNKLRNQGKVAFMT